MNIGRNDPCPCGRTSNGKPLKYKKCCLLKQHLINSEWQEWFDKDIAKGNNNLAAYEEKLPKNDAENQFEG